MNEPEHIQQTKTCTKCGRTLPADAFWKQKSSRDGLQWNCKDCLRAYRKQEHVAEHRRKYMREYMREYQEPTFNGERKRKYMREYMREYRNRPDERMRRAAYGMVRNAVILGILPPIKECACVHCGEAANDYHHDDYTKPLEVTPVCRACHAAIHLEESA